MTFTMIIEKAGKPADVRGAFAPAMNRMVDAGKRFERNEGIDEGLGG